VAHSTHHGVVSQPEITQRDMRQRSKEIMDAVEGGQSFTVTRDGHLILRRRVDVAELPNEMAISAVTLAELSADLHQVRPNSEQDTYDEHAERARRLDVLQRAQHEFDPIPFGAEAARTYGRVAAAVVSAGRSRDPESQT
jgi:predicted nucleic acid-binding protein